MEKRLGHGRARSRRPMHKLSLGLAGMALGGLGDRRGHHGQFTFSRAWSAIWIR